MTNYEKPEMEVIIFSEHDMFNDVVTSPGLYASGGTGNETPGSMM